MSWWSWRLKVWSNVRVEHVEPAIYTSPGPRNLDNWDIGNWVAKPVQVERTGARIRVLKPTVTTLSPPGWAACIGWTSFRNLLSLVKIWAPGPILRNLRTSENIWEPNALKSCDFRVPTRLPHSWVSYQARVPLYALPCTFLWHHTWCSW